jgi:hypothetical protein
MGLLRFQPSGISVIVDRSKSISDESSGILVKGDVIADGEDGVKHRFNVGLNVEDNTE